MRKNDTKLFLHDKAKLYQMVNMRVNGVATSSLGILFNCDRSSIESQLDKYSIKPKDQVYTIERIVGDVIPEEKANDKWLVLDGRRINRGKSYEEYLKYPHRSSARRIYT